MLVANKTTSSKDKASKVLLMQVSFNQIACLEEFEYAHTLLLVFDARYELRSYSR